MTEPTLRRKAELRMAALNQSGYSAQNAKAHDEARLISASLYAADHGADLAKELADRGVTIN
jgi:hypothetical protein